MLFIFVDDLRPELGAYGSPVAKTPNMDALAQSGTLFQSAFVSQAVCGPSRAALLTGLRPETTNITYLNRRVDDYAPQATTMLDMFKAAGYNTVGIGKIYQDPTDDANGWSEPWKEAPPTPRPGGFFVNSTERWANRSTLADTVAVQMAISDLRRLGAAGKPFFLGVGIQKPHLPFVVPSEDWDRYSAAEIPQPKNPFGPTGAMPWSNVQFEIFDYDDLKPYQSSSLTTPPAISAAKSLELRWGYLASVSYVDGLVGELMAGLKSAGLDDNTIVVLWGDHGFKLGDHGFWAKHSDADVDLHIPLIVRAPGVSVAGSKSAGIVESVDIYPTLAELAGLPTVSNLEGLSFVPLMKATDRQWKEAAFASYPREGEFTAGRGYLVGYTVRSSRYRYTAWVSTNTRAIVGQELYDLTTDPDESTNVARTSSYSEALASMEQLRQRGWQSVRSAVAR